MNELRVYGHYLPKPGTRIAQVCRRYDVDPTEPVLLVMATRRGPDALATALASAGERPVSVDKHGKFERIVEIRTDSLSGFATQHPERLLGTAATGRPPTADARGLRPRVWADLAETTTQPDHTQTGARSAAAG